MPTASSPRVLGIDDFALRRRRRYGTAVVDVIASEIVDLLPDRTAAFVSSWLTQHEAPEFICRDRAGEYASGARQGAPHAVQVADRFHLACNSSNTLERVLHRHAAALRACIRVDDQGQGADTTEPPSSHLSPSVGARPNGRAGWRGTKTSFGCVARACRSPPSRPRSDSLGLLSASMCGVMISRMVAPPHTPECWDTVRPILAYAVVRGRTGRSGASWISVGTGARLEPCSGHLYPGARGQSCVGDIPVGSVGSHGS